MQLYTLTYIYTRAPNMDNLLSNPSSCFLLSCTFIMLQELTICPPSPPSGLLSSSSTVVSCRLGMLKPRKSRSSLKTRNIYTLVPICGLLATGIAYTGQYTFIQFSFADDAFIITPFRRPLAVFWSAEMCLFGGVRALISATFPRPSASSHQKHPV